MMGVLIQIAICIAWGVGTMVAIVAALFIFGCVMSAICHKDFEPYEWPHYVGFTIITLAVLALMGAMVRPDWSV